MKYTPYGPEATDLLARWVSELQGDNKLQPVTVVVPSNIAGLTARRALGGRDNGIAGVSFLSLHGLAERLAGGSEALAGRVPLNDAVLNSALRQVLKEDPGRFKPVAKHHATEEALARCYKELRDLSEAALDKLAAESRRAADVVRVFRSTKELLLEHGRSDEHDLLEAATKTLREGSALVAEVGPVVVYLAQRLSRSEAALLRALSEATQVVVLAGLTGIKEADEEVLAALKLMEAPEDPLPTVARAHGHEVITTSDAEEEARVAVELVLKAARSGTALSRIAVLHGSPEPYARMLHEQFAAAGIVFNGPSRRRLSESRVGRVLLGLLRLRSRGFRQKDLFALLDVAHVPPVGDKPAPVWAWEQIARRAGVVAGLQQWEDRLARFAAERRAEAEKPDPNADEEVAARRVERLEREAQQADDLAAFAKRLEADLRPDPTPVSWREWCEWARGLISTYTNNRWNWPEAEQRAADAILSRLDQLVSCDEIDPGPSLRVFGETLERELDASPGRLGRFGNGVFINQIGASLGVDLDLVVVVGLQEGMFPRRPVGDPLLPDREREVTDGELQPLSEQVRQQHRALLATYASAKHCVLVTARGDARTGSEQYPSRWVLETAAVLHDPSGASPGLSPEELHKIKAPWLRKVPSFAGGVTGTDQDGTKEPATEQAFYLQTLAPQGTCPVPQGEVPVLLRSNQTLAAGAALSRARAGAGFNRFNGNLDGVMNGSATEYPVSPTRLETWADCPMRYFLQYVLGVERVVQPEDLLGISALDRGTLLHEALDRFFQAEEEAGTLPAPGVPWSQEQRDRLVRIGEELCDDAEQHGLTGRPVFWDYDRKEILEALQRFLVLDDQERADMRATLIASELSFGFSDAMVPAVPVPLEDGRTVEFRGRADQVYKISYSDPDNPDGLWVVDIKTGKSDGYTKLSEENPDERGTKLQLPVYGLAARILAAQLFNRPDMDVRADYRFIIKQRCHGYNLTDDVLNRLSKVVTTIVKGIEAGMFCDRPPPGSSGYGRSCDYCDPEGIGTDDRRREWERLRKLPELGDYWKLTEEPDEDGVGQPPASTPDDPSSDTNGDQSDADDDSPIPDDQSDRDSISQQLADSMFVEAGAGSGKTTQLVARVLALLEEGVAMENIAAITFTEKAAAELRDRIRRELNEKCAGTEATEYQRQALRTLDAAAITTLHGFAMRILREHAIEAELPPRFEVSPSKDFAERWDRQRNELLSDPGQANCILLARAMGIQAGNLKDLAEVLDDNWDLVEEWIDDQPPPTGALPFPHEDLDRLIEGCQAVATLREHCQDDEDKMHLRLQGIGEFAEQLDAVRNDEIEVTRILFSEDLKLVSNSPKSVGRAENWTDETLTKVRKEIKKLQTEHLGKLKQNIIDPVLDRLARVLGSYTLEAAKARRAAGVLEFHDLLVFAKKLLRHHEHGPEVREILRQRYQRLLLDEHQDTDPIQMDIAALITARDPQHAEHWTELEGDPGRIFLVGDPKQSIYRFRRADISQFMRAGQLSGMQPVSLTRNFRSSPNILKWVNRLFRGFMVSKQADDRYIQPDYKPLGAVREAPPSGPHVAVLGTQAHPKGTKVEQLRTAEAQDVADTILTAISQEWPVDNGKTADGTQKWRPARLEDICILLPTRTSLPQLEHALEQAKIPYRIEAGSLLWGSRAARDLMMVVRALTDTTNQVTLVQALRSPAFGCGDDDLYTFKKNYHGKWNFKAELPEDLPEEHPVGQAMRWLNQLHKKRSSLSPSQLIERIIRERRLMETACFGRGRPRDAWRSYRLVLDQARAFGDDHGGGLREFVAWVDEKIEGRARESDFIVSETDDDAVRIATIHAAKGREFPIVILSGTNSKRRTSGVEVAWPQTEEPAVHIKKGLSASPYLQIKDNQEAEEDAERIRLLYVALTRARDHLVVSTHREARKPDSKAKPTLADQITQEAPALPPLPGLELDLPPLKVKRPAAASSDSTLEEWQAERTAVLNTTRRPLHLAATAVAKGLHPGGETDPGLNKDGPDSRPQPPWQKGRYGTAVGRAVHGVLQSVDLTNPPDLEQLSKAQAESEGVPHLHSLVQRLAESALASQTVREAASAEHWKELFLAAPIEQTTLEGFVDLLYRTPDGLVVADYKTDKVDAEADLEERISRYRLQLKAYVQMVEKVTGEQVVRATLVFCRDGQPADERHFKADDL